MWLQSQLSPDSAAYNSSYVYRLKGPLDLEALRLSFDSLVSRHEALRTKFIWDGEDLYQEPQPPTRLDFPVEDLTGLPEAAREERAYALIRDERLRPFRFDGSPLVRLRGIRMGSDDHILCASMHHIVTDGWSKGILWRDLGAFYSAALSETRAELPELPIQFADYAAWHRKRVEEEIGPKHLSFWMERLKGAKAVDLPMDRPRPAHHGFVTRRFRWELGEEFYENLVSFGKRQRLTPFMMLLAGYEALLHRVSGERDFVVGVPTANRTRAETHDLIGFFVNLLGIRASVSGDMTFADLVENVRSATLEAYDRQEVPLELVLRELGLERDSALAPLFRTLFVMQNATQREFALAGVSAERIRTDIGATHFDQSWSVARSAGGLAVDVDYNPDLFDASTIERTVRSFDTLLKAALEDPARKICDLPLMSAEERNRIVLDWNRTDTEYLREASIHGLFRARARQFPSGTAVICGNERVTYAELDRRSEAAAARLAAKGVGPGNRVALVAERSIPAVVGLLGILKVGGVYVPIDPSYPPARIRTMLEQCGVRIALAHSAWQRYDIGAMLDILPLEEPLESEAPETLPEVGGDAAAYVNFTSGSTGRPKAIEVTHRNVIRLLHSPDFATLDPDCVVLHLSPLSFDASTFEVWGPLLHGGTCAVLPDPTPTIDALKRAIAEHKVTTLWLTATLFHAVVDEAPEILKPVREILTGGERVSPDHVRKALALLPGIVLRNAYGPTEATTFATSYRIPPDFPEDAWNVPIGRPVCNARVYILDQYRNPVPVRVPGEMYIGGDGVAKGYVGDETLTKERFLPDPFAAPSARLYRTGDKARFREDGTIEFLGRLDRQVKIRGHRIEPGEVERVLLGHPDVRQSVVEVAEDDGEKRLIAYAVPGENASPSAETLLDFLRGRLPNYMIPAELHVIPQIPISPTGKVDRSALPCFRPVEREADGPSTATEIVLREIWEGLFRVRPIGANENFFRLGGHSILAVRLASRIEARLGVRLPLSALFEAPTIRQQARWIDTRTDRRSTGMVKVQEGNRRPALVFVPGGDGFVMRLRKLARAMGPGQPLYSFQEDWEQDNAGFASFEEMAAKNVQELKRHGLRAPYYLAGFCTGSLVALEMARRLREEGCEVAMLALIHPATPGRTRRARSRFLSWLGKRGEGLRRLWSNPPEQILAAIAFCGFLAYYVAEKLRGRKDGFMHRLVRGMQRHAIARMLYRGNVYPGKITILAPKILYHRRFPIRLWESLTHEEVEFRPLNLSHQDVLGSRGIPRVARELEKIMAGRRPATPPSGIWHDAGSPAW